MTTSTQALVLSLAEELSSAETKYGRGVRIVPEDVIELLKVSYDLVEVMSPVVVHWPPNLPQKRLLV